MDHEKLSLEAQNQWVRQQLTPAAAHTWPKTMVVETVDSTNTFLRGYGPGTAVLAHQQTAGRGRLDRQWSSTPGSSFTASYALPVPNNPGWLPLLAANAVARAVESLCPEVQVHLKWPNDVLVVSGHREAKIGGLLAYWDRKPELLSSEKSDSKIAAAIVMGIGLNLSLKQLPTANAGSLHEYLGPRTLPPSNLAVFIEIAEALSALISDGQELPGEHRSEYERRCVTIGQNVRIQLPEGDELGVAIGIDNTGQLLVKPKSSAPARAFSSGDVIHVRPDRQES